MIPTSVRLLNICKDPPNIDAYKDFYLPFAVEDMRSEMVVQIEDPCSTQRCGTRTCMTMKEFTQKYHKFSPAELAEELSIDFDQFTQIVSQLVPCVGCRKSVEKLYLDLEQLPGIHSLYPMQITGVGIVCDPKVLKRPDMLYDLLISKWSKVQAGLLDNLTKCRKNKRCQLHCLDMQILRGKAYWSELWDIMTEEARDECCIIDTNSLLDMLEAYITKHRFCGECKVKVLKAYSLLVGDVKSEPGYNASIYEGLHYCASEDHLHLKTSDEFLNTLCSRAEPEVFGNGRERHAKTIEVAQGEVVLCLGLYMYDRLHKIISSLKSLDQTFQIVYCACVVAMHNAFQVALERKFGVISRSLENLCAELQEGVVYAVGAAANNSSRSSKKKKKSNHKIKTTSTNRTPCNECGDSTGRINTSASSPDRCDMKKMFQVSLDCDLVRIEERQQQQSPVTSIKDDLSDAGYSSSSPISEATEAIRLSAVKQLPLVALMQQSSPCVLSCNRDSNATKQKSHHQSSVVCDSVPLICSRERSTVVSTVKPCHNTVLVYQKKNSFDCDQHNIFSMLAENCSNCTCDELSGGDGESDVPLISASEIAWFEQNKTMVNELRSAQRKKIRERFSALVQSQALSPTFTINEQ